MINEPYDGKQGGNHCQNNSIGFDVDPGRQGILFEFRNDILTDPQRGPKLRADFIEILTKILPSAKTGEPIPEPLKPEEVPGKIYDRYESNNSIVVCYNQQPKVRLAFIAEHAGKDLPEGYEWPEQDKEFIVKRNLHYDANTLELANYLASKFETSLIATRYSKLLVDPNRQLTSPLIFPQSIYGVPVMLNKSLNFQEESRRYDLYFLGLVKGIMYLHKKISCHFWFSIQSFDHVLYPDCDLVISFYANEDFAKKTSAAFESRGYKVRLNTSEFDGQKLFGYTNTTFLNGFYPRKRESLIFLISSRLLATRLDYLKKDFKEIIKVLCLKEK